MTRVLQAEFRDGGPVTAVKGPGGRSGFRSVSGPLAPNVTYFGVTFDALTR